MAGNQQRQADVSKETDASIPVRGEPLRVLMASHSHPVISKGGAEIAAYELFRRLRDNPGIKPFFLACSRDQAYGRLGSQITQPFADDEFVYMAGQFDWFKFANQDARFPTEVRELLRKLRPDVLHFHHYANFGVEIFDQIKEILPNSKIIVTLHEFLAICNHYGQMITKGKSSLCYKSGDIACTKCFPEIPQTDFFLRKHYIMRFFDRVDHFISPSHFLAERYIDWGLDRGRVSVIENVTASKVGAAANVAGSGSGPLRVGFFGQISYLKGINVLLEAARMLEAEERLDISFEIHGDYRSQPPDFQADFLKRLENAGENVIFHGPYDNRIVDRLMHSVDLILMPSIWWENSPVVIQEAFRARRPVICSDIGGMAEKIRDGVDGFHFPVGSAIGLAGLLKRLASNRKEIVETAATLKRTDPPEDLVLEHLRLYETTT
jgi:glycosyltransferase involved in cell wall biosynthesis